MTDETGQDLEPAADAEGGGTAVAVAERPGQLERAAEHRAAENRKDRLWLPFLIPVGAILAVALFTINISRVFLAASEGGSTPAVVIGALLTVGVLAGAAVISAIPKLRTSSLVITMSVITAIVLLAGSLVLGASEPEKAAGGGEPTGAAINTLTVDAFNFHFQAKDFPVPAGVNEIKYESKEGSHTLVFVEPQFSYFKLVQPGGKAAAKIEAVTGQKYTIYCDLPGHRAAGMEATITVGAAGGAPEAGTATPSTTLAGGTSETTAPAGQSETDSSSQSGNSTGN